jgi:hypothetical protein
MPNTILIPLDVTGCLDDANWISYLIVQVDEKDDTVKLEKFLRTIPYVMKDGDDYEIDDAETASMVRSQLEGHGFTVLSTAIARGLNWMKI